ncbi:hypothetical protein TNCV_1469631 [Trichonephila clavipes]|nr:hypothetical protein TNCV_1469631 [Trichonephila clavipes]
MAGNAFDNTAFSCAKSVGRYSAVTLIRISDTNLGPSPGDDLSNKHMTNHWVSLVILFDCQYPPETRQCSRTRKSTLLKQDTQQLKTSPGYEKIQEESTRTGPESVVANGEALAQERKTKQTHPGGTEQL